jgi:hypothetical protein
MITGSKNEGTLDPASNNVVSDVVLLLCAMRNIVASFAKNERISAGAL